jgi:diacylglycerol diphosphate phosphatase/phosphatidate phosphatase
MGIFSRKPREGPVVANTTQTDKTRHGHTRKERRGPVVLPMDRRPTFGQWLKATWLDILTMAIMGIIGLGVCFQWYFICQ